MSGRVFFAVLHCEISYMDTSWHSSCAVSASLSINRE